MREFTTTDKIFSIIVLALLSTLPILFSIIITGCGVSSQGDSITYDINGSGTIPYEENQTIQPDSNVDAIDIRDNGVYIVCSNGSTCTVQVGDTDNSQHTYSDNSVKYDLIYFFDNSTSCCYSCGECNDTNVTPPAIAQIPDCNPDFSGGGYCKQVSGS